MEFTGLTAQQRRGRSEMNIEQLKKDYSVQIMMDGNCGCALLGQNLQEGEAEFVCIDDAPDCYKDSPQHHREKWAMAQAYRNLIKRINNGDRLRYHYPQGNN